MGEIWAHFRDEMEREREGIENGGNERGGAAEGFSDYVVIVEEDVVGVISDDETTVVGNGFGICDHDDDVLWGHGMFCFMMMNMCCENPCKKKKS